MLSGTVEKALRVLELLSTYDTPVRLADLSRELDMNKSTTYRMLERMSQLGYVRQDEPNGRYMLTVRMWEVGVRAFRRFDIRSWARPYIKQIERRPETAILAILDGQEVVIVDKFDSARAVQTYSPLGSRSPVHCSSLGKAFLMADLEGLLRLLKKPLQSFTSHTITSVRDLRDEIATAQRAGVATAFDEFEDGVSGVSAPIIGVAGTALGVIGITLPSMRAKGEYLDNARSVVRDKAARLSIAMGYAGPRGHARPRPCPDCRTFGRAGYPRAEQLRDLRVTSGRGKSVQAFPPDNRSSPRGREGAASAVARQSPIASRCEHNAGARHRAPEAPMHGTLVERQWRS